MYGALLGDIIGSPYEFNHNNIKTTDFPLFSEKSSVTDDTIMTLAVGMGIIKGTEEYQKNGNILEMKRIKPYVKQKLIESMQEFGKLYPYAGYGIRFDDWLKIENPSPYESCGNGSAMRISFIPWFFDSLFEVEFFAQASAEISHNHPEGIKGAKVVASAIFLARNGASKEHIKSYIEYTYKYDLTKCCDEIRPTYKHIETCQETIPQAFAAFFEGNSFESVIRLAVSLGGDSDTIAAISGSIAEAFYGIPDEYKKISLSFLDDYQKEILLKLLNEINQKNQRK